MPIHEPLICRRDGQLGETDGFRCRSSEEERSQEAGQADKPTKRPTVQCERTPPPPPLLQGQPRHQLTPRCTMEKEREPPMAASLSFLSPSAGGDDVALPSRPNTTAAACRRRRRRRRRRHYVASLELEHAVHAKHLYSEDIFRRRRRHDRSRPLPSSMGQSVAGARSVVQSRC